MKANQLRVLRLVLAGLLAGGLVPAAQAAKTRKKAKAAKGAKASRKAPVTFSKPKHVSKGETFLKLGMGHLDRHEYTPAIDRFNQAVQAEGSAAAYFMLGYAHYQRGFIGGTPETADRQDAQETINAYNMALAIDPALSGLREPHRLHQGLAMAYEAVGDNEKAMEAYKRAFMAAPENAMMPLYAARLRLKMGDAEKAEKNLSLALLKARSQGREDSLRILMANNPLFAQLRADARMQGVMKASVPAGSLMALKPREMDGGGYGLRDSVRGTTPAEKPRMREKDQAVLDQLADANEKFRFRQWREAIAAYSDAMTLNQDSAILGPQQLSLVYEKIGTCYNKLGLSGEAVRELQRAVQIMPYNASAHYQLALAHSLSGRYAESLKSLREAFKTAPSPGELRRSMLLAKTDTELEPVRDLPAFTALIEGYREQIARR